MTNIPANRDDPRRRYMHQAYVVTTLGSGLDTGPAGYGQRLTATSLSSIAFQALAGSSDPQTIGTVTQGVVVVKLNNHKALSSGTIDLALLNADGTLHATLEAAGDLTVLGPTATFVDIWEPLASDKILSATVTGGTPGEIAMMSLHVTPFENAWF
jgi:hypothetical protein